MKLQKLISKLSEIYKKNGNLDVSLMTEIEHPVHSSGMIQAEHDVSGIAVPTRYLKGSSEGTPQRVVIIGQELDTI